MKLFKRRNSVKMTKETFDEFRQSAQQRYDEYKDRMRKDAIRRLKENYPMKLTSYEDQDIVTKLTPEMFKNMREYWDRVRLLSGEYPGRLYFYSMVVSDTVLVKYIDQGEHMDAREFDDIVIYEEEKAKKYCNLMNAEKFKYPINLYTL
jgi:hypothetical protein